MMKIKTVCPICGKVNYVEVPAEGFCKWQEEGMPIQFAMPELSANEREMLKTGICPTCWDKMWSEDTEEDEDPDFDPECNFVPEPEEEEQVDPIVAIVVMAIMLPRE